MISSFTKIVLLALSLVVIQVHTQNCVPDQLHLSLGDAYYYSNRNDQTSPNTKHMATIVFQTQDPCQDAYTEVLLSSGQMVRLKASETNAIDVSDPNKQLHYTTNVHVFKLYDTPEGTHTYKCYGNSSEEATKSDQFRLPTLTPSSQGTKVLVYGDHDIRMGMSTFNSIANKARQNSGEYAAVIGLGDYGYDFQDENGGVGDSYMRAMESFASTTPFMGIAGNHEEYLNYTFFNFRFRLPLYDQFQNTYYSYNLGLVHYVCFNIHYFLKHVDAREQMLKWFKEDLENANEESNRKQRPWIVAVAHKPFFTSVRYPAADTSKDYGNYTDIEDLFYQYSVDLYLAGHVHFYERMNPVYRDKGQGFDRQGTNYIVKNAKGTVMIIDGIGGTTHFTSDVPDPSTWNEYTVAIKNTLGFGVLEAANSTHLSYVHRTSEEDKVEDMVILIKDEGHRFIESYTVGQNYLFIALSSVSLLGICTGLIYINLKVNKRDLEKNIDDLL